LKLSFRTTPLIPFAFVLWVILALSSGRVLAQQGPPPHFDAPGGPQIPERVRERVELLLKWKIIEVLDLNEEQSNKVFPLYSQLRRSRHEYTLDRMKIVDELKRTVESDAGEAEIEKALAKLDEFERSFEKSRKEMLEAIKKSLTLEQWANYLIFEAEFPFEIRKMMRENRTFRPNRWPGER
jgi:Spy/CpxP family protein refolding chaperone